MVKLVEKNGELGILITHVNEEGIRKRTILSLRKIAVTIGLTVGISAIGIIAGKSLIDNYQNKENERIETLANLDENEKFIEEQLANYTIALDEYNNIVSQQNHNESEKIEKRIQLVSEVRNLQTTANKLIETKIAETLGIDTKQHKIYVERISNGSTAEPIDIIKVVNNNDEVIFYSDNIPNELSSILDANEGIDNYRGNGENSNWEQGIDDFSKIGNELESAIIELAGQNYTLEDGNIKVIETAKSI